MDQGQLQSRRCRHSQSRRRRCEAVRSFSSPTNRVLKAFTNPDWLQCDIHSRQPRTPLRNHPVRHPLPLPSISLTFSNPSPLHSKERKKPGEISRMTLTGEVAHKTAILIDDMADTCGTLCTAAEKIKAADAAEVISIVTHGILSGEAINRLNACRALSRVVVTNTVPLQGKEEECEKIVVVDVSPTLAGELFLFLLWGRGVGGRVLRNVCIEMADG